MSNPLADLKGRDLAINGTDYAKRKTLAFTSRIITATDNEADNSTTLVIDSPVGVTGSRPGSPVVGDLYFDTTIGIPVWWNGSDWVNYAAVVQ